MNTASADPYASEPALAAPAHRVHRIVDIAVDAMCVFDQFRAGRSRVCPLTESFDELKAKPLLEFAHLKANSGLREVQALRGSGKAPESHDLDHRAELIQVQAAHLEKSLIVLIKTIELTDYALAGIVPQTVDGCVLPPGRVVKGESRYDVARNPAY